MASSGRRHHLSVSVAGLIWRLRESPEEDAIEYLRTMLKLAAWGQYFSKSVAQMYDRLTTTPQGR